MSDDVTVAGLGDMAVSGACRDTVWVGTGSPPHFGETAVRTCPNHGRYNDCHGTGRYWYDEDTPMAGQIPAHWCQCAHGCGDAYRTNRKDTP